MKNPRKIKIGRKEFTMKELGEKLQVTVERVRQLEKLGLLEERVKGAKPLKPWGYRI